MKFLRKLRRAFGRSSAGRLEFKPRKPAAPIENIAYVRTAKVGRSHRVICPDWDDAMDVFDE